MQEYDFDVNKRLDREEFAEFIRKLTADSLCHISLKLVITFVAAPLVGLMAKRATEQVPRVGPVVQRVPNSVYASIIALGVVLAQKSGDDCVWLLNRKNKVGIFVSYITLMCRGIEPFGDVW